MQHVRQFRSVMRGSGLTLKLEKCQFDKPRLLFWAHHRARKTWSRPLRSGLRRKYEIPETKKEVRQVLAIFSYFRSYIRDFAETAKPLTELTKNGVEWTQEHQRAFDKLKSDLANAIKLHIIHLGEPCGILVDASSISVGCCLIQWTEDGLEKPLAFAGAKLTPT